METEYSKRTPLDAVVSRRWFLLASVAMIGYVGPIRQRLGRFHIPIRDYEPVGGGAGRCDHLLQETGDAILKEDEFYICLEGEFGRFPVDDPDDDGDYNGGFDVISGEVELGNTGSAKKGWFLFTNTGIPRGATILSAALELTASSDKNATTVNLSLVAADEDNPSRPTNVADAEGRPRTTASVDWNGVGAWTNNEVYTSPSIVTVIQELVDRSAFSEDNILMFVEDNSSTANAHRNAKSYRGDPAKSAVLLVQWEVTTLRMEDNDVFQLEDGTSLEIE